MENNRDNMKEEGPVSREQLYAEVWAEPMTKARTLIDITDALSGSPPGKHRRRELPAAVAIIGKSG